MRNSKRIASFLLTMLMLLCIAQPAMAEYGASNGWYSDGYGAGMDGYGRGYDAYGGGYPDSYGWDYGGYAGWLPDTSWGYGDSGGYGNGYPGYNGWDYGRGYGDGYPGANYGGGGSGWYDSRDYGGSSRNRSWTQPQRTASAVLVNPNNPGSRYSLINLRSGPSKGYGVIGQYRVGTWVDVLEQGRTWCKVYVGGRVGYIMTYYLSLR